MKVRIKDRLKGNDDGIAIIVVVAFLFIIAAIASSSLMVSTTDLKTSANFRLDKQLFYVSEAGIYRTVAELNNNSYYTGTSGASVAKMGSYTVTVSTDADTSFKTVTSTGNLPGYGLYGTLTAKVSRTDSIFDFALYSKEELDVASNATTDSYNSNNGAYGGTNTATKGNIGSNEDVDLENNITISGNVQAVGNIETGTGVTVTGTSNDNGPSLTFPAVEAFSTGTGTDYTINSDTTFSPGTPDTNNNYGDVKIRSNKTLTLSGTATYYFDEIEVESGELIIGAGVTIYADRIEIESNEKITIVNSTTLYIKERLRVESNATIVSGSPQKPSNLIVYGPYDGPSDVVFNSNNAFYGVIYAPDGKIDINSNGHFYGSFIAEEIDVDSNAKIHYDEALSSLSSPYNRYELVKGSFLERF